MSQPVLTGVLGLAISIVLVTAAALATSAAGIPNRAIKLTVIAAVIVLIVIGFQRAHLRINFTGSIPIGAYLLSSLPSTGVKRGMLVAACASASVAATGQRRGYLSTGPCYGNTELLLKCIAAIAGDKVNVTSAGTVVNGRLLRDSRPVPRDRSGRRLVPWPQGGIRLRAGEVWLYAANDRSWDSRYWGPAYVTNIIAIAWPVTAASYWPLFGYKYAATPVKEFPPIQIGRVGPVCRSMLITPGNRADLAGKRIP